MSRRRPPYQAGDWFAVPLSGGGFALGLTARMDGRGIVLGYFFGPRLDSRPTLEDTSGLDARSAIFIHRFGDLGLIRGTWTVIGRHSDWRPEAWPVPVFGRVDIGGKQAWRVRLDEATLEWLTDEPIGVEQAESLPEDGLLGFLGVEHVLAHLLGCRRADNLAADSLAMEDE